MDITRIFDEKELKFYEHFSHIGFLQGLDPFDLNKSEKIETTVVHRPTEEYTFLHEVAIIEFQGVLFTSWYNCPQEELHGKTVIRGRRSKDGGKTWTEVETIAEDQNGKILYCPPVYGICDGKLYMLINEMVGADLIHALDCYVYNENTERFDFLWSKPIPFKLNTNVYRLTNGKLMLPGRVAKLDGFPNTPAVLISDSGKIDGEWRLVKIAEDGNLPCSEKYEHPEATAILVKEKIYMFVRNDCNKVPLVYISEDNGEHWSKPFAHDIPFSSSKIYSGTLSNGRNYLIGNISPNREKLAIFFTDKNSMKFNCGALLRTQESWNGFWGRQWSYPVAYEYDGKLYVIYSAETDELSNRGAILSVVPIDF